jgi:uncharacterized protein (TIGR00369 family)
MARRQHTPTTRTRLVSWQDPTAASLAGRALSGIDYLRALSAGDIPPPPMAELMRMRLRAVDPGFVRFDCEPDESTYNTLGVAHGGFACTLLDTAAGCALHSVLGVGQSYTSVEIKVSYLKAIRVTSGSLTVTGRVVKAGARVGFTEATLTDHGGSVVATATSTLLVFDL